MSGAWPFGRKYFPGVHHQTCAGKLTNFHYLLVLLGNGILMIRARLELFGKGGPLPDLDRVGPNFSPKKWMVENFSLQDGDHFLPYFGQDFKDCHVTVGWANHFLI